MLAARSRPRLQRCSAAGRCPGSWPECCWWSGAPWRSGWRRFAPRTARHVLALARSVPAGHVVQPGDLRVVKVTPTAGLDPVPAVSESSTVGRPAAVALVAGTLLTPADLGTPSGGSGDVVAVALKAGAYPPSLGPGGRVDVVPVVGGSSSGSTPVSGQSGSIGAVVLSVDATPAGSSADAVVSLQVNPADADEVAALAAAGQIALVELPSGSGS